METQVGWTNGGLLQSREAALALVPDDRWVARFLAFVLVCAVFFPYVQLVPLNTDTQPYALAISAVVVMAARDRRMPAEIALLLVVLFWSLLLLPLGSIGMTALRSLANYFSVFFVALGSYIVFKATGGLSGRGFKLIVWAWFLVGFVQTFVYADFLVFLTPRALGTAGSGGRGVVALSPEPTHYGLYCIFLLLLNIVFARMGRISRRERNFLTALLVVQVVFFARSSMAVLLLGLWGVIYVCVYAFSLRRFLSALLVGILLAGVITWVLSQDLPVLQNSRLYTLSTRLLDDPMMLLLVDMSVNDRFFHIVFSIQGALTSFGFPHGFTAWTDFVHEMMPRFSPYAWNVSTTRIMSGYGSVVFETGALGILIPVSVTLALFRFFGSDVRAFLVMAVFLNLMMLTSIPIAFPLFGYLIGLLTYASRSRGSDSVTAGVTV